MLHVRRESSGTENGREVTSAYCSVSRFNKTLKASSGPWSDTSWLLHCRATIKIAEFHFNEENHVNYRIFGSTNLKRCQYIMISLEQRLEPTGRENYKI